MPIFPVVAGQVPIALALPGAADPILGAVCRKADNTAIYGATTGGTVFANGLPLSGAGQLIYVDATLGLPAGTQYENGLPIAAGAVCISTSPVATYTNGLPFDANGALCALAA